MKLVTDERCRIQSRELFKPNTPYQAERSPDGSLRIVELIEREVPTVRARKVHGKWVGAAGVKLNREQLEALDAAGPDHVLKLFGHRTVVGPSTQERGHVV